jgi:hypothetical protein
MSLMMKHFFCFVFTYICHSWCYISLQFWNNLYAYCIYKTVLMLNLDMAPFHHQWHRTCSPITAQFKCLFLYDCVNILLGMTFISHPFMVNINKDNPWSPCTISEMRNRFSVILLLPLFSESCRNCQQGFYLQRIRGHYGIMHVLVELLMVYSYKR